jgi:hypothetical protein
MFVNAINEVAGYTRAIHSISRNFGGTQVNRGSATLFFVNSEGWALTCKHVAQWLSQADQINRNYTSFLQQSQGMSGKQQNKLAQNLGLGPDKASEMRITFVDCVDSMNNLKFILHPDYDLALIKFEGVGNLLVKNFPYFMEDESAVQQGAMLCRLGFPFPE